jgi:hypothetical protein
MIPLEVADARNQYFYTMVGLINTNKVGDGTL